MIAMPRNRRRPLRVTAVLAVLAILYLGTFGTTPASAGDIGNDDAPWAAMAVSVQARVSAPTEQAPYDAQVTLDYVVTNTGQVPIYQVKLTDPLVPGRHVDCDGDSVIRVLMPNTAFECSTEVELPPGTYTSRPQALGWVYFLILGFPVTASGQVTFTVTAPSPPASSSASPTPTPTPTVPVSSAPPSQPTGSTSPATHAPSSSAALASQAPSSSPTLSPSAKQTTATPSPGSTTPAAKATRRAVFLPSVPTARVRQLSTHVMVLLLLLPAAVGAAVAGAAAARRR